MGHQRTWRAPKSDFRSTADSGLKSDIAGVPDLPKTDINVVLVMGAEGLISKAAIADSDRWSEDKFVMQQFRGELVVYSSVPRSISEATLK